MKLFDEFGCPTGQDTKAVLTAEACINKAISALQDTGASVVEIQARLIMDVVRLCQEVADAAEAEAEDQSWMEEEYDEDE